MIKHTQIYVRHSLVPIKEALDAIKNSVDALKTKKKPGKVSINGQDVNAKSIRLQTFLEKGLTCACCGRVGTHFALERGATETAYHLNLWSTDESGDEYLMTHDHILARSLGGADNIKNTQTMCSPCNAEKGADEQRQARENQAIKKFLSKPAPISHACGCMGPQDGDPVCPCQMAWVIKLEDGFYEITENRSPDGITHTAVKMDKIKPIQTVFNLLLTGICPGGSIVVIAKAIHDITSLNLVDCLSIANYAKIGKESLIMAEISKQLALTATDHLKKIAPEAITKIV